MPIIKSAIKRVRQAAKRRSHNLQVKRSIHADIRAVHEAVSSGDAKTTITALRDAQSELDRAVKKGVMHRNTASRRKSQLAKKANPVIGGVNSEAKPKATTKAKPKAAVKKPVAKNTKKK
jgi:small subunit ribosomal protein S20